MNVRLLHLPVKGAPYVQTLMEASTAHVHSRAQVGATPAVAVPALGEEHVAVTVQMISPATAHPGIQESVAKNF